MRNWKLKLFCSCAAILLLAGCGGGGKGGLPDTASPGTGTNVPTTTARAGIKLFVQLDPSKTDGSLMFYEVDPTASAYVPAPQADVSGELARIKCGTSKIGVLASEMSLSTTRVTDIVSLKTVPEKDYLRVEANLSTVTADIDRTMVGGTAQYAVTPTQPAAPTKSGVSDGNLPQVLSDDFSVGTIDSTTSALVTAYFVRQL